MPEDMQTIQKMLCKEKILVLEIGQSRITAGNYYYRNSTSDEVLWTAQNFRTAYRGSFANPTASQFSLTEDNTNKKFTYLYNFTGSLNSKFLFTLGTTGNINTTSGSPSSWETGY